MPKNDKAREKKVNVAVKALMRFPGMRVHEAMHFAQFSKKEIDNVTKRKEYKEYVARVGSSEVCGVPVYMFVLSRATHVHVLAKRVVYILSSQ